MRSQASSPRLDPRLLIGKTPDEIDRAARSAGLIPRGPDPLGGKGSCVDPVTGVQRLLIHADEGHFHLNDPSGQRLDADGHIVAPEARTAHLPLER